jgi:2-oxoglutarate ferredoxin oxidoreductase subunit beta
LAVPALGAMPASWRAETKPHKFCPGCGHGIILKMLGTVVDELGISDRLIFGCDIGCSLLAWDFFNLDSIQAHHGRVTPVLAGLKTAAPHLLGVAYMGDGGGYAIGAQHLVASATRNDRITVIVVNNTQYGITGGQMSPTTLPEQVTETTPFGRDPAETGWPFQGPEMVATLTNEHAYVARGTVTKPRQLKVMIRRALENQMRGRGFSFVEALSFCPTNWRTAARETVAFVDQKMSAVFRTGEIKVPHREGGEGNE